MAEQKLELSIALANRDYTCALNERVVVPDGIDLNFIEVKPIVAAFRRMVRSLEFDVCELAPTTYLAARQAGVPLTALPVFLTRRFHHGDIVCRPDSGISEPKDLAGRRVGVRAYTVSTAVWARGILASEYGLDLDSVTWVVDDEDHVTALPLPSNVEHVDPGDSIAGQFARGEIDAALTGPAGIGRSGAPKAGWSIAGQGFDDARQESAAFQPLFPDAAREEFDWYRRTGIYPIHGLVAIKNEVLAEHPWVAASLMAAFTEAKAPFLASLLDGDDSTADLKQCRAFQAVVGADPLPYGLADNQQTLQALIDFSYDQHILATKPEPNSIFAHE